jgi:hypothetical protein
MPSRSWQLRPVSDSVGLPAHGAGVDALTENNLPHNHAFNAVKTSRRARRTATTLATVWMLATFAQEVGSHSGPPYPIVTDRTAGPYRISVWTDPDATDDGTLGGQFWVILDSADGIGAIPPATRVGVTVQPRDRPGTAQEGVAAPDGVTTDSVTTDTGNTSRHFVALLMDHEGTFGVHVSVRGPMGEAGIDAEVEATYDLRPPPITIALYVMPFLLVGGLWLKLLLRRRARSSAG